MRVTVLTPDLSSNCVGRAYILARMLQRLGEVEIVGPALAGTVWRPLASQQDVVVKLVPGTPRTAGMAGLLRRLSLAISGEIIYASKPLLTSYGVGLTQKYCSRKPLVLDIDDWQGGFQKHRQRGLSVLGRLRRLGYAVLNLADSGCYANNVLGEKLIPLADEVTVANSFLQNKFGGTIIWHARDTAALDPERFDKAELRQRFGIAQGKPVITFLGTPHEYKGLEDLINAVSLLDSCDPLLMLVGFTDTGYSQELRAQAWSKLGKEAVCILGLWPLAQVPQLLAVSDVLVIPQRNTAATIGQTPAKIFDAMAMAKPIVVTAVSEIPDIVGDCGWVARPDDPNGLAEVLRYVLEHPDEAERKGKLARERCKAKYSWDAMEPQLLNVFARYR